MIWIIWFAFGFCYYGLILSISKIFANDKMEFKFMPIIISCVAELVGTTIGELEQSDCNLPAMSEANREKG